MFRLSKTHLFPLGVYWNNVRQGAAAAGRLAFAWWLAEVVVWLAWPGVRTDSARNELFAALCAACLVGLSSLVLCPVAALLVVGLSGRDDLFTWVASVKARVRQARLLELANGRDLTRLLFAGAIWFLFSAYVSWRLCLFFLANIATARVIATACTLGVLAVGVATALLAPVFLRLATPFSLLIPARWSIRRGWIAILTVSALLLGATAFLFSRKLAYLPWRFIVTTVLVALFFALFGLAKRASYRPWLKRYWCLLPVAGLVLVAIGTLVAIRLTVRDSQIRSRVAQDSTFLPLAYRLVKKATDFDSDGFLNWWGENDCAPWNARIHPLVDDPLSDHIDQDCDGADGSLAGFDPGPGRADYQVPDAPSACPLFLITLDAVSAKELAIYGGASMPLLSRRARQAVVFDWAFSQGPSTRLSVPSMLASRYDTQISTPIIRTQPAEIDSENELLGEILARARYHTAAVAPVEYLGSRLKGIYQGFKIVDRSPVAGEYRRGRHTADLVTAAAEQLVFKHTLRSRFFLWVHYFDPHEPFSVEPGDTPKVATEYGRYQYELDYLDRQLDKLLSGIESRYAGSPHVVIVTADHGEAFDARRHRVLHHGYDLTTAVTRVPLMIWGVGQPRREKALVGLIDLTPTLVNIARGRFRWPEGNSLLPLLAGEKPPARALFGQFYLGERRIEGREPLDSVSVRYHPYVLHYSLLTQAYTLYNYETDPQEVKELSQQQPEMLDKLRVTLGSWLRRVYPKLFHL